MMTEAEGAGEGTLEGVNGGANSKPMDGVDGALVCRKVKSEPESAVE